MPAKLAVKAAIEKLEFNWQVEADALIIETETKDFSQAIWVITEVAKAAKELNHHPDVNLSDYNKLQLRVSTHSVGGISDKDLALAERVDAILARI